VLGELRKFVKRALGKQAALWPWIFQTVLIPTRRTVIAVIVALTDAWVCSKPVIVENRGFS